MYLMCASGTGEVCEYKVVRAQYEFLEVGGESVLLFCQGDGFRGLRLHHPQQVIVRRDIASWHGLGHWTMPPKI